MGLKCGVIGNTLGTKKNPLTHPNKIQKKKIKPFPWPWHMHMSTPILPPKHKKTKNPIKTNC
jgi:hypothetical protein